MTMRRATAGTSVLFALFCLPVMGQNTFHVSLTGSNTPPYDNWGRAATNIRTAVEAASNGDTVLVTNGVYVSSGPVPGMSGEMSNTMVIVTNGITITSVNGRDVTFVDGNRSAFSNRCFFLAHPNAVLEGFTITNGYWPYTDRPGGAGVYISTNGTVRNCRIAGNRTSNYSYGGGLYLRSGGLVENCDIIGNRPSGHNGKGGGAYLYQGGIIRSCTVISNEALGGEGQGGGVYMNGAGIVEDCTISYNYAHAGTGRGGGLYITGAGGIVRNCIITYNKSIDNIGCTGGGVYFGGSGLVRNCLIANNACVQGGGIYFGAAGTAECCTVVGNYAISGGGGVYKGASGTLRNVIVYFNESAGGANYNNITGFSYCCTTPEISGSGNVSGDPLLADMDGGDYKLLPGSPCIDVGLNQDWMTGTNDLGGNERVINGTVDMGCYEYKAGALDCGFGADPREGLGSNTVVFTAYASGTNTVGLYYRWDFDNNAVFDKEGAGLNIVTNTYASPGSYSALLWVSNAVGETSSFLRADYIKVGPEVAYVAPDGSDTFPYSSWESAAANIPQAVAAGVDGTLVRVADGVYGITNQILINRAITVKSENGAAVTLVVRSGATNHRIFFLDHSNAVLDGLTLTNGYAPASPLNNGGGVWLNEGGTVRNCVITGNKAPSYALGGGVYFCNGGLVEDCRIVGNTAYGHSGRGGGAYFLSGGTLSDCDIGSNLAGGGDGCGGGLFFEGGGVALNCVIVSNTAGSAGRGGGVYFYGRGLTRNCLIKGNKTDANDYGGGANFEGAGGVLENCTVTRNTTGGGLSGGGVRCASGGTILNSIIHFNNNCGTNWIISGVGVSFTNCCTTPTNTLPGSGNITNDPLFAFAETNNFRLLSGSPCINAGTNQEWMAGATDLDGTRRIFRGVVDIGAYEKFSIGSMIRTW